METVQKTIEAVRSGLQEGWSEDDVLKFLRNHLGRGGVLDAELVEGLGDIADVRVGEALQKLLVFSEDKVLRKGIKRSLYRIKSRGIPLPEEPSEVRRPIVKRVGEDPPMGRVGSIDGFGRRFLVLGMPQPAGGYTAFAGFVSDTAGWVDFWGGRISKKAFTRLIRDYQEKTPFPLVEAEPAYVVSLFEETRRMALRDGRMVPKEYLNLRPSLERIWKNYERPLIYTFLEPDRGPEADWLLEKSGDLLWTDLFVDWGLEIEGETEPYIQAVQEVQESRLVITEGQKKARLEEIRRQALLELFPEPRRLLYKRRLEEMAYILYKLERHEEARTALMAAVDLEHPFNLLKPNPFLLNLVARLILRKLAEGEEKKEEEGPSLIIRP